MTGSSSSEWTVSVVVPVHDGARYLGAAIDSILNQDHPVHEIIVVDDGSTDGSLGIARQYPQVHACRQDRAGPAAARNLGVSRASGALLAFLDADDLWLPGKLATQVAVLGREPAVDVVFGRVQQFVSDDLPAAQHPAPPRQDLDGLHVGTMLARRTSFDRVGPFGTDWRAGEFIDWFARARSLELCIRVLPEVVMRRRLHAANLTRSLGAARSGADYLRILRTKLKAQRTGPEP